MINMPSLRPVIFAVRRTDRAVGGSGDPDPNRPMFAMDLDTAVSSFRSLMGKAIEAQQSQSKEVASIV